MRVAVCSDEPYEIHGVVLEELRRRGHEAVLFGSVRSGEEEPWVSVAREAAEAVASGDCVEGIFFCWTGTGISMAANKVPGIRAALCCDPETARGARVWNHANVLALSNRLMSRELVLEVLEQWLDAPVEDPRGVAGVEELGQLEEAYFG